MLKTKQALITQINSLIKTNDNNEITGAVLNGVLRDMAYSLASPYFLFPKHDSVSQFDIGKIVMNDGSGTAKVYAYSPATTEQLGEWKITVEDIGDLSDDSEIEIKSNAFKGTIDRVTWRNGGTPTTVEEEFELLRDYINNDVVLSTFLTASVADDELTIEETSFQATKVSRDEFSSGSLVVVSVSQPAMPAAPTAFPLGKLIGIDGNNAIISSKAVETYLLDAPLTINNNFFDIMGNIDYSAPTSEVFTELLKLVVIPSENGNARSVNGDDIFNDDASPEILFRHQFLGIAIAVSGNKVTVYDLKQFSLLIGILSNLIRHAAFNQ